MPTADRRQFLGAAAAALSSGGLRPPLAHADEAFRTRPRTPSAAGRKPIAVVGSVYRPMSHAYHIAGRFLHGYQLRGRHHLPTHYVASLFMDQKPKLDLTAEAARDFGVRLSPTIEDALTLGTGTLAVDGVLLVCEHGDYPLNARRQILYPRYEMFERIAAVIRDAGRAVPVFNDKHLSYSRQKANKMVATARELKVPFMAGSSLPVTWRRPEYEPPLGTPFTDGLVVTYGHVDIYGCHGLEALQCMLERRAGGETGVAAVTALQGDAVWAAGDKGLWDWDLLEASLSYSESVNPGPVRANVGLPATHAPERQDPAVAYLVEYRDGTRGAVLFLNGHTQDVTFAGRVKGRKEPVGCQFVLPRPPGARFFDALTFNIERLLTDRAAPYPVERTLLTTCVLDLALESLAGGGGRLSAPELDVRYAAPADSGFLRGPIAAG